MWAEPRFKCSKEGLGSLLCCSTVPGGTGGPYPLPGPWRSTTPSTCRRTPASTSRSGPIGSRRCTTLASFYTWFLEDQGLEGSRAIGFSMGGWLAAEVATVCRHAFRKLMLVGAAGVQPRQGEITDIFLITPAAVNQLIFHDPAQAPEYDQLYGGDPTPEERYFVERNREMAVRLCWKPYMFDPTLPPRLGRVRIPVRMVWGQQDRLIPVECGDLYRQAIPGSDLVAIESCGHSPQIEKPEEFVKLALDFLA